MRQYAEARPEIHIYGSEDEVQALRGWGVWEGVGRFWGSEWGVLWVESLSGGAGGGEL